MSSLGGRPDIVKSITTEGPSGCWTSGGGDSGYFSKVPVGDFRVQLETPGDPEPGTALPLTAEQLGSLLSELDGLGNVVEAKVLVLDSVVVHLDYPEA